MNTHILEHLTHKIEQRKKGDTSKSYVADLLTKGTGKIAEKVGEEAIETVIAAMGNNTKHLTHEAADLLFHLMILLSHKDLKIDNVLEELVRRQGVSGLTEKQNRHDQPPEDGR